MRVVRLDVDALGGVAQGDHAFSLLLKARLPHVRLADDQVKGVVGAVRLVLVRERNVGRLREGHYLRRGQVKVVHGEVVHVEDAPEAVPGPVGRLDRQNDVLLHLEGANEVTHGQAISGRVGDAHRADVEAGEEARRDEAPDARGVVDHAASEGTARGGEHVDGDAGHVADRSPRVTPRAVHACVDKGEEVHAKLLRNGDDHVHQSGEVLRQRWFVDGRWSSIDAAACAGGGRGR